MDSLLQDIRYGARMLWARPGFTVIAALSLALGIGANTAIFTLVNDVLLKPVPVADPGRLVVVSTTDQRNPGNLPVSHLNFLDIRDQNRVFSAVAGQAFTTVNVLVGTETVQAPTLVVTWNYFQALGLGTGLGRLFLPQEDQTPGSHPVVIMSHGLYERRFGSDPSIVNRTITLNRQPFTVIGVTPRDFDGTFIGFEPDLYVPMMMHDVVQPGFDWYNTRRGLFLFVLARLKPDTTLQQARANLASLGDQFSKAFPVDNRGRSFTATSFLEARIDPDGEGTLVKVSGLLMTVVGVVLLIACANIANLLLVRTTGRRKEVAIRLAMGASRVRLVRQLLTESLVLALVGGALGVAVAYGSIAGLVSAALPLPIPVAQGLSLDTRVLLFALGLSVLTGIVFGLVPALQASKPDVVPVLKNVVVSAGSSGRRLSARQVLIVAQVALSLVALIGAGLFLRSLDKAQAINPGFEIEKMVILGVNLGREGYTPERGGLFYRQVVDRLGSLPGVRAVSVARDRPFGGGLSRSVFPEGQETASTTGTLVQNNIVDERYFATLGIPVTRGRAFGPQDAPGSPAVAIVNETMASRFWKGQNAVGKRFRFFGEQNYTEIVGVVRDAKYNSLTERPQPFVYEPLRQDYAPAATIHVRTGGDAAAIIAPVRETITAMDRGLSVFGIRTAREQVDRTLAQQRMGSMLLGFFGGLALVLAAIGIYGVTNYSVSQRTREIGIRMALGAGRTEVMSLVLGQSLALVAIGLAIGVTSAALLARLVGNLLFGVQPTDPATLVTTSAIMTLVAATATFVPARRASRLDPLVALRYE
ncbi:MAG: ABC transporter permease [Acidobacteria bacterium]|nr:ABC transporter permease [Acidobacteriota bacterium]